MQFLYQIIIDKHNQVKINFIFIIMFALCQLKKTYSLISFTNNKYTLFDVKKKLFSNLLNHNKNENKNQNQKIVFIKSNKTYHINNNFFNNNKLEEQNNLFLLEKKIFNKKILHIKPAGLFGFYNIGICKIIKQRYNLDNYIFNGASAGAWNSLIMVYKYDHSTLIDLILSKLNNNKNQNQTLKDTQKEIKKIILSNYKTTDFELDKLFISVCVFENNKFLNYVYTDFASLECAIDCCIASSNIPILTGNFIHKYQNKLSYDGAFLRNIHILHKKPDFVVKNCLFGKKSFFISMFDKKHDINKLYYEGQNDTIENLNYLDKFFY